MPELTIGDIRAAIEQLKQSTAIHPPPAYDVDAIFLALAKDRDEWKARADLSEAAVRLLRADVKRLREALAAALRSLEATRWMCGAQSGSIGEWAETPEGQNHGRVCEAMESIRAALGTEPKL